MYRAARFYRVGTPLRVEEMPVPEINDNEALITVRAAAMCHSDVHVITGVLPVQGPVTLGHEIAGDIEEVGENVKNIKKGDRGVVHFLTPCGECHLCLTGKSSVCKNIYSSPMYGFSADGGYAEYIKVDAKRIVPLASKVPYEFGASLGCAGITAIHAVNSIGKVSLGDRVAVYGTGGVGMYVLQLAKLSGAEMTIAIGRTEDKLRMAQKNFGVDEIINISTEKLRDGIKRIMSGKGVDIVFDCVVNNESIDSSLRYWLILANL